MSKLFALLSGLVFGLGLLASGMTDPMKVKGFLDLFGAWDPSLALVMGGAILIGFFAFRAADRRSTSWSGEPMDLPRSRTIDARLLAGGVLFGVGWGVAGYCPGPALVAAGGGSTGAVAFVAAMLVGMALHDRVLAKR
jgi:uncharacterized membrane protein YedE/YeeE